MKHLLILTILISTFSLTSQSEIKWGNVREYKTGSPDVLIGKDKNNYILYGKDNVKKSPLLLSSNFINVIYNFNAQLNFESSNIFTLKKHKEKEIKLEEIIMLDKEIIVFSSYYDKKEKKSFAYGQVLNTKGESKSDIVELGEIQAAKFRRKGFFDFVVSANFTSFLVYENPPFEKYNNEKFKYKVYNKDLKIEWEAEIVLPFLDKEFAVHGYFLDANNNVYMIATILEELEKGVKRKNTDNPHGKKIVLVYDPVTKELTELDLKMKSTQRPTEMAISVSDEAIKIVGFYADGKTISAKGVFFYEVSTQTKQIIKSEFKEFSKEFVSYFVGDKKADKEYGLFNYEIRDIVLHKDNSLSFVSEYYKYFERCHTDPKTGRQTCTHNYLYHDIIVTRINPEGKVSWTTRVPKRQHTVNDNGYYSSFAFGHKNGNIFLVYNDNPKNIPI